MLDQSFSAKNFYNILIAENRKGINVEGIYFKEEIFDTYTIPIKEVNKSVRVARKRVKSGEKNYEIFKRYLRRIKRLKKLFK